MGWTARKPAVSVFGLQEPLSRGNFPTMSHAVKKQADLLKVGMGTLPVLLDFHIQNNFSAVQRLA
jgi:hypothetical protein